MHLLTKGFGGRISRKWLLLAGVTIALVLLLRLGLSFLPRPTPSQTAAFQPLTTIAPQAQRVEVGFYPMHVYELNIASNTYYIDAYVWLKWQGKLDPIANLEFTNAVDEWGMTQRAEYEKPIQQADGSWYQGLRIEGRFFQPFGLSRYPLDQQQLGITIENSIYTANQLVYVADTKDSGYVDTLSVQGWQIRGWRLQNLLHTYPSRFGFVETATNPYSAVRYELQVTRPLSYFLWKLLLPLVIVLASSWGALLLNPTYVDPRIAIPITALLTIVFLQQSYSSALPESGYLVLLDKIYALAYLLVIATIMEAIVTADWVKSGEPEAIQRVLRLDRPFLIVQCFILVSGILLLITLA
ncbi:hypothetical protein ACN4EK_05045 [Pantanalinema rosaneae CENA516]|uniref:hypothetical protein n=1 Tax=Pantanalinema rosaneae TaxID=1620701 RepID=UPI003D6FA2AE